MSSAPDCRSCGAPLRHTFVDLGEQPLSNGFLTREQLEAGDDPRYPLHARVCEQCLLVQVDEVVPADAIFSDTTPTSRPTRKAGSTMRPATPRRPASASGSTPRRW